MVEHLFRHTQLNTIPVLSEEEILRIASYPGPFPEMIRSVYVAGAIHEKEYLERAVELLIEENCELYARLQEP